MQKHVIRHPLVPETGGPFNMAVRYGGWIFISGLPPFDAAFCAELRAARLADRPLPKAPARPIAEDARIVLDHMKLLLEAAGSSMDHLLKVVVWLRDQDDNVAFDKVYRSYFSSAAALPARTRIQAGRTPLDCGLEIDAIGYVPGVSPDLPPML
jgi:2-iminobutanoate/2-iminopropanoate deaminase